MYAARPHAVDSTQVMELNMRGTSPLHFQVCSLWNVSEVAKVVFHCHAACDGVARKKHYVGLPVLSFKLPRSVVLDAV